MICPAEVNIVLVRWFGDRIGTFEMNLIRMSWVLFLCFLTFSLKQIITLATPLKHKNSKYKIKQQFGWLRVVKKNLSVIAFSSNSSYMGALEQPYWELGACPISGRPLSQTGRQNACLCAPYSQTGRKNACLCTPLSQTGRLEHEITALFKVVERAGVWLFGGKVSIFLPVFTPLLNNHGTIDIEKEDLEISST